MAITILYGDEHMAYENATPRFNPGRSTHLQGVLN